MRIRNRTRTSCAHVPIEHPTPQTNVCELNRSPWDVHRLVMEFSPTEDHERPLFIEKQVLRKEIAVEKNGSRGLECVSASVVSLQLTRDSEGDEQDGKVKLEKIDDKEGYLTAGVYVPGELSNDSGSQFPACGKMQKNRKRVSSSKKKRKKGVVKELGASAGKVRSPKVWNYCKKNDGKGWQCRREVKLGHSLCDHHLSQMRSYYHSGGRKSGNGVPPAVSSVGVGGSRKSDSGGHYYYYTEFGPSWRKRRRVSNVVCKSNDDNDNRYVVDDNESSEEGFTNRERKPMKARSLKSLLCNSMAIVNRNYFYDDGAYVNDNADDDDNDAVVSIKMEAKDRV